MPMIKTLTDAVIALLPAPLADELRESIDTAIRNNLEQMELVSQEQFAVQQKVLQRTRQRVEELEQEVSELERLVEPGTATEK